MTDRFDKLRELEAKATKGPWDWHAPDYSAVLLTGPDIFFDHVLESSPCEACQKRADPKEWVWGRCTTPKEHDAAFIAEARNQVRALLEERDALLDEVRRAVAVLDTGLPMSTTARYAMAERFNRVIARAEGGEKADG